MYVLLQLPLVVGEDSGSLMQRITRRAYGGRNILRCASVQTPKLLEPPLASAQERVEGADARIYDVLRATKLGKEAMGAW